MARQAIRTRLHYDDAIKRADNILYYRYTLCESYHSCVGGIKCRNRFRHVSRDSLIAGDGKGSVPRNPSQT